MTARIPARRAGRAFTLIELLVSLAIFSMILVLTASMVTSTQDTLRTARAGSEQFQSARRAFETITRRLGQATLNTYWDYDDPEIPTEYLRQSELHFVSGSARDLLSSNQVYTHAAFFIAPFGFAGADATGGDSPNDPYRNLESLLNAWGFYITWSDDDDAPPFIAEKQARGSISRKSGFRLMEFRQPSEQLRIYSDELRNADSLNRSEAYQWFRDPMSDDLASRDSGAAAGRRSSRVVAENIIAMVIRPVISPEDARHNDLPGDDPWEIAPEFLFDSREWQWGTGDTRTLANRNQLPPVIELTLVALQENSFRTYQKRKPNQARQDIEDALTGLFLDPAELEDDLDKLSKSLTGIGLEYRIFQASVGLRTAKWSN